MGDETDAVGGRTSVFQFTLFLFFLPEISSTIYLFVFVSYYPFFLRRGILTLRLNESSSRHSPDGPLHLDRSATLLLTLRGWLLRRVLRRSPDPSRPATRCSTTRNRSERQHSLARAVERCSRTTATAGHTCFLIVTPAEVPLYGHHPESVPLRNVSLATLYIARFPFLSLHFVDRISFRFNSFLRFFSVSFFPRSVSRTNLFKLVFPG